METFSVAACSAWLAERNIAEAPYGSSQSGQFALPPEALRSASVVRQLVDVCCPFGSALLQFTDWSLYRPDEMAVLVALRAGCGDQGRLIDTPGHLFSSEEADLLAGTFSLAAFYHWSAYLYFDHRAVLHCWEGELLDLWTPTQKVFAAVCAVFTAHRLSSTLAGVA